MPSRRLTSRKKEPPQMKWPFAARPVAPVAPPPVEVANTIGAKTFVKGDIRGDGFRIEGTVDGLVDSSGPIFIGESGVVNGCIRATDLVILGRVEGGHRGLGTSRGRPARSGDRRHRGRELPHAQGGHLPRRQPDETTRWRASRHASWRTPRCRRPARHSRPPVTSSGHRELASGALVSRSDCWPESVTTKLWTANRRTSYVAPMAVSGD